MVLILAETGLASLAMDSLFFVYASQLPVLMAYCYLFLRTRNFLDIALLFGSSSILSFVIYWLTVDGAGFTKGYEGRNLVAAVLLPVLTAFIMLFVAGLSLAIARRYTPSRVVRISIGFVLGCIALCLGSVLALNVGMIVSGDSL